jgi:selenide,water dikinase
VDVADGADPILVDLAFDPQTSGGLLVACPEERAPVLVRRLGGRAQVVGRCVAEPVGRVRLV